MKSRIVFALIGIGLATAMLLGCSKVQNVTKSITESEEITKEQAEEGIVQQEQGATSTPISTLTPAPTPTLMRTPEPTAPAEVPRDMSMLSEEEQMYAEILDGFCRLILSDLNEMEECGVELVDEATNGVWEADLTHTPEETLTEVGYAFRDVNEDGIPELFIGDAIDTRESSYGIYAAYTCVNGEIYLIIHGWSRNFYGWLGENRFYNKGSSGMFYEYLGEFELLPNATQLTGVECYFTDGDTTFYHNQNGEQEPEKSEVADITNEEFWQMVHAYRAKEKRLSYTPLSHYYYLTQDTISEKTQPQ